MAKKWKFNNDFYSERKESQRLAAIDADDDYSPSIPSSGVADALHRAGYHDWEVEQYPDIEALFGGESDRSEISVLNYQYARLNVKERKEFAAIAASGDDAKGRAFLENSQYYQKSDSLPFEEAEEMLHIRALAKTGQLLDYKADVFRRNYVEAMKKRGIRPDLIERVEKMGLRDFSLAMELENPSIFRSEGSLPSIADIYLQDDDINEQLEDDIANALGFDLDYVDGDEGGVPHAFDDVDEEPPSPLPPTNRRSWRVDIPRGVRLRKKVIKRVGSKNVKNAHSMEEAIFNRIHGDLNKIRVSKSGNYYIPFVGTSASRSAIGRAIKSLGKMKG